MGYFLPSFVQKRLLRYALSRLELVDTDALDLDNLGITWGQRSSFELKNVGLRLQVSLSIKEDVANTTRRVDRANELPGVEAFCTLTPAFHYRLNCG